MSVKDFFAGLGKSMLAIAKYVLRLVPDAALDAAFAIVKQASIKFIDNTERREWAVGRLVTELKIPESLARWLVETAVLRLKAEAAELLDNASDEIKKHNKD